MTHTMSWADWRYLNSADLTKFAMPDGFKSKAYMSSIASAFLPSERLDFEDAIRMMFVVVVHQNERLVKYELGYCTTSLNELAYGMQTKRFDLSPVPASALQLLFGDDLHSLMSCIGMAAWQSPWDTSDESQTPRMQIEIKDNRTFFVCDRRQAKLNFGGLGADYIGKTPAFSALWAAGAGEMSVAILHPDKIHSLAEAQGIYGAICSLRTSLWDADSKWYDKEIALEISNLNEARAKLSKVESDVQKTCEDAADSMNVLADRFGIEIAV